MGPETISLGYVGKCLLLLPFTVAFPLSFRFSGFSHKKRKILLELKLSNGQNIQITWRKNNENFAFYEELIITTSLL